MDLNQADVRVNMVSPTWVETPMLEGERKRVPVIDDIIKKAVSNGRAVGPDEVAAAALYLCRAEASFITGSNIMIGGGLGIGPILGLM
jgi:NAD(P)-dependent dehydrogenase (short-subunit alcohol dehydrogenase family)